MEQHHPDVYVLTDGSGHTGTSRLDRTTGVLRNAASPPGSVYGKYTDRRFYEAILGGDVTLFTDLALDLADALARKQVSVVASDAAEGYNPSHDICRYVSEAAVRLAQSQTDRRIDAYDFLLVGPPDAPDPPPNTLRLVLDDAALNRKIAAAHAYSEIAGDVEAALRAHGREAFRVETLRPAVPALNIAEDAETPYYERYGEKQVAAGHYREVLKFRDHVLPIAIALAELPAPATR